MTKILVCNPAFYGINYEINPWMKTENQADRDLAYRQWEDLVTLLASSGATIYQMSGRPNVPDIVFTANAGLMVDDVFFLSNFKHPERQPEKEIYKMWMESRGYQCVEIPANIPFEGAGDCLIRQPIAHHGVDYKEIYCGYGFRSDPAAYDTVKSLFAGKYSFFDMILVNPYFYHLDTCFCPLPGDCALIYPGAFDEPTIEVMDERGKNNIGPMLLKVPEDEARRFACNAVAIGNRVILPSGCPHTTKLLEAFGFEVYATDMSEFIKAGGACKCLTLQI